MTRYLIAAVFVVLSATGQSFFWDDSDEPLTDEMRVERLDSEVRRVNQAVKTYGRRGQAWHNMNTYNFCMERSQDVIRHLLACNADKKIGTIGEWDACVERATSDDIWQHCA
ncbi:MAG: hypothetical protein ISN29_06615 [Gammaproteobacteria bacterium AqS3]|nr:hypothetical protein [Gammaproteobacteria bacterium AqS3]